jgi:hypothetical protein
MAVALEFANAVFKKSALEQKHPGGLEGFFQRYKPFKILFDDFLVVVSFLSTAEADHFVQSLSEGAFEGGEDYTVLEQGADAEVDWLETKTSEGTRAAWLKGEIPGDIIKSIDYDMFFLEGTRNLKSFFAGARREGFEIGRSTGGPGQVLAGKQLLATRGEERTAIEYFRTEQGDAFIVAIHPENPGASAKQSGALSALLGRLCMEGGQTGA